ncbi:MAG: response regulator [Anaerolineaceae bacterium]|nr:response regulator [Anaerolineaceae bacterium]
MGQNDGRADQRDGPLDFVLDLLHEGVCVTDTEGRIQWSNEAFRRWDTPLAEMVMSLAQRAARRVTAGEAAAGGPVRYTAHERTADGRHAEIVVTPVLDCDGKLARLMATVMDRTAQVVLQQKIQAIEEAGRKLLHLEPESIARMTPSERLTMLQRQIITLTRNLLKFDHFRIRLRNPETNRLELVLTEGPHQTDESRELFAEKVGSGITGYVASTGAPYICNDVRSDPRYLPGLVDARSSLTVPLWHNDKVVGIFNVEHHKPGAFGQQDLQALEIFSHYVAQALVTLQLLVAEKVSTSDQLASDVTVELSDPLNRILAATGLLKADYIGQDSQTTRRLDEIAEAVDRIRSAVRQVTDLKRPIIGPTPLAPKTSRPLAGRRLLVADDEPTIRDSLSTILSDLGAAVDLARDGQEAVAMGQANRYDMVLADIRMPHKNGYQVFTEIRLTDARVPVVLMTAFGYDPSHSIVKASGEGLQAVLFKPFKIQVLYEQISRALNIEMPLPTAESG